MTPSECSRYQCVKQEIRVSCFERAMLVALFTRTVASEHAKSVFDFHPFIRGLSSEGPVGHKAGLVGLALPEALSEGRLCGQPSTRLLQANRGLGS